MGSNKAKPRKDGVGINSFVFLPAVVTRVNTQKKAPFCLYEKTIYCLFLVLRTKYGIGELGKS